MDTAIAVAIIAAVQAVGVAVIGLVNERNRKKAEEYRKVREKLEAERDRRDHEEKGAQRDLVACMLDLDFAMADGVQVLLHQAHGEKINGNVEEALASIDKARGEFNRKINRKAVGA